MKLICNKQSLYEALINVSKAVADKSTIPALEGIKTKVTNAPVAGMDIQTTINTEMLDICENALKKVLVENHLPAGWAVLMGISCYSTLLFEFMPSARDGIPHQIFQRSGSRV